MNKEIFVCDDRCLKLTNVLCNTINADNLSENHTLEKIIRNFNNYIKNNGLSTKGPMVVQTKLIGGDEPKMLIKILQQINGTNIKVAFPYEIIPEINSGLCIYSRFDGYEVNLTIAQSKMQVYAYENNYVLDTTSYVVYVKKNEDGTSIIDSFVTILGKEK